jgi:hypothetical protein
VEELHVEAVLSQPRELRDSVVLLEGQDELLACVRNGLELIGPELERGGLLTGGDGEHGLDVVRASELVGLSEQERPALTRRDPVLIRGSEPSPRR